MLRSARVFGSFSVGDVSRQALDAQKLCFLVKFGFCRLLQPNLAALRTAKLEIQGVGRLIGAQPTDGCLEAFAILRVDTRKELGNRSNALVNYQSSIVAAP